MTPRQSLVQAICMVLGTIALTFAVVATLFFVGLDGAAFLLTENMLMTLLASAVVGAWLLSYAVWLERGSR